MWIEFDNQLVNLEHVKTIWIQDNWINIESNRTHEFIDPIIHEEHDTPEQAQARYDEIKKMLTNNHNPITYHLDRIENILQQLLYHKGLG